MPPSLALFAALLLAPLAAHTETVEVVQSGKAVNLFPTDPGSACETKDAKLFLKGDGLTFFAKAKLGGQFTLKARLAIERAGGVNPTLIFNGVDNFAFDGGRILPDGLHVFAPLMRKQAPWNSKAPASVAARDRCAVREAKQGLTRRGDADPFSIRGHVRTATQ
jgi:hypothetical protein